ncbi:hypothetical protein CYLTODRAFT_489825 [Cylindrobasidium torrendii FP15055 ss-10]|uniref:Uncharacterized protein n=1 Tax=Cylindrobasidium torrendii FP15055 ss-10 TaxID=1314674 RepID=A0A0D7BCV8_9AGAR|nr:hypothetical protein CYLTODRAFT_489825 [Cylindrobasidium torrendii FP15055 ss-10]
MQRWRSRSPAPSSQRIRALEKEVRELKAELAMARAGKDDTEGFLQGAETSVTFSIRSPSPASSPTALLVSPVKFFQSISTPMLGSTTPMSTPPRRAGVKQCLTFRTASPSPKAVKSMRFQPAGINIATSPRGVESMAFLPVRSSAVVQCPRTPPRRKPVGEYLGSGSASPSPAVLKKRKLASPVRLHSPLSRGGENEEPDTSTMMEGDGREAEVHRSKRARREAYVW